MSEHAHFSTRLGLEHRERLEAILHFNPRQTALGAGLEAAIVRHGLPRVAVENGALRIRLGDDASAQTMFLLDAGAVPPVLAAVAVLLRPEAQTLAIAHLAVAEEYATRGLDGLPGWGLGLVLHLQETARRIRGVRRLELPYWTGQPRHLLVS